MSVRKDGDGGVLVAKGPNGEVEVPFDRVLVAIATREERQGPPPVLPQEACTCRCTCVVRRSKPVTAGRLKTEGPGDVELRFLKETACFASLS